MIARPLASALCLAAICGAAASAAEFAVPPTPDHYVTDNANALSAATRASVENELHAYEKATGHQIIVFIGETTGDVPLETYTAESAHRWRIGRRGHDDGAVLFLFMQDHKIRIEVGYGLESALTDAASYRIIQDVIRPRMRAGDVDGAVSGGVAAMLKTITPAYAAVTPAPEPTASPGEVAGIIAFVSVLGLLAIFAVVLFVLRIIYSLRYGYLVLREGSKRAKSDMARSAFWGGAAGGGDFGGGGASGSW